MNRLHFTLLVFLLAALFSCKNSKTATSSTEVDSVAVTVADTAVYGICAEGTTMNMLQIKTDEGNVLDLIIGDESTSEVCGGMFSGDRFTATYCNTDMGLTLSKAINLRTLLGHWTSLDRNFEICEDGTVNSSVSAETKPYTSWAMVNANIVFNTDTFSIVSLGADSLTLENAYGIFVYKRQR